MCLVRNSHKLCCWSRKHNHECLPNRVNIWLVSSDNRCLCRRYIRCWRYRFSMQLLLGCSICRYEKCCQDRNGLCRINSNSNCCTGGIPSYRGSRDDTWSGQWGTATLGTQHCSLICRCKRFCYRSLQLNSNYRRRNRRY